MEAKCPNCREIRQLKNLKPFFTANGAAAVRGQCVVCSNLISKSARIPEHDTLPQPVKPAKPPKPSVAKPAKASEGDAVVAATAPVAPKAAVSKPRPVKLAPPPTRTGPPLVIVESPTKAKTIGKFLGRKYQVKASVGHIRDLPKNRLGVDLDNDFAPSYVIPMDKKKTVKELQTIAREAREIWLATDPDREGEAISWHLTHALKDEIAGKPVQRVEFHEITQNAINEAFAHPRQVDLARVDAQQARRVLDRLVGYTLSPLLRDKMGRKGLSAGRVQSVALRLVCERERDILAFVPVEYWTIDAELSKLGVTLDMPKSKTASPKSFVARLTKIDGKDADLHTQAEAEAVVSAARNAIYRVQKVERKDRVRKPAAPFTTSTLQQEANRKLGFNAKRTMAVAQQLYEGLDVGEGPVGLITYMRTDSTNVASLAQDEARKFIAQRYGEPFMPPQPPKYSTRAKNAQEAHEAVRPTSVMRVPDEIKAHLDRDQYRLYDLIWKRFVASQMSNAIFDTTTVDVEAKPDGNGKFKIENEKLTSNPHFPFSILNFKFLFRASGSIIKFPGFLRVYEEGRDEGGLDDDDEALGKRLPPLEADEALRLDKLIPAQKFTQPPPHFTEATLIKAMEEYGIGRPSTYAATLGLLQSRFYVTREAKALKPTPLGFQVNDLLVGNFADYINVDFTARVEDELDSIESGGRAWPPVLHAFYDPFKETVQQASLSIPKQVKLVELVGQPCPKCGKPLVYKQGKYGRFIGCSDFPKCTFTEPLSLPGVACPKCGGKLAEKRVRKAKAVRVFYGCLNYPTCDFTTWNKPLPVVCPNCGKGLVVENGKDKGKCLACEHVFAVVAAE